MVFGNLQGLYLLGFIIPLIILYLIKAKPIDMKVPSVLFFLSEKKNKKYNALFQKLIVRTLFFIQLFFLGLIALAAADPVLTIPMDAHSLNTVIIVDVSASMNTKDSTITRFEIAEKELLEHVKGKVSIILAEESPIVIAKNVSARRAKALLTNLEPKEIPTRLDSAMLLAKDLFGEERATIVVYSDFLLKADDDILSAKKTLETNDKRVVFVQSTKQQPNIGFTSLSLFRGTAEILVKNFGDRTETIDITLKTSSGEETSRVDVSSQSVERLSFPLAVGETEVRAKSADRMQIDNTLRIMNPYKETLRILFITNQEGDDPLLDAIEANPQFSVQVTNPPVIPELTHDVVFVSHIAKENLLPNTYRELSTYMDKGGRVVLTAFSDLISTDTSALTEMSFTALETKSTKACVEVVNAFTKPLSSPRCFSEISSYITAEVANNASSIIASTTEGQSLFVLEGNLFYYGILEGGFDDQISYPLFWDALIDFMLGRQGLDQFNYKTGDFLLGENSSNKITLDKSGWLDAPQGKIAINLLDEDESNLYRTSAIQNNTDFEETLQTVPLDVSVGSWLLLLATLVFAFELFYIKRRGDL